MDGESTSDPKFELGHVLFIDIVGYSKLLIDEQTELVCTLTDVVRKPEQVRAHFGPKLSSPSRGSRTV